MSRQWVTRTARWNSGLSSSLIQTISTEVAERFREEIATCLAITIAVDRPAKTVLQAGDTLARFLPHRERSDSAMLEVTLSFVAS